ncbi:contactin-like [Saccostrea cucullata]|uniref:contactin-like n=1 Tax=Saccostrea cuccullata TaxID=36930 RepID=UPI002ED5F24F
MNGASWISAALTAFFVTCDSQLIPASDCPLNWYPFEKHCYKFIVYPLRTFREAATECEEYGAGLLSVNSAQEHEFINNLLKRIDQDRSLWYTSGHKEQNHVKWTGDGTVSANDVTFWASPDDSRSLSDFIVYKYSVSNLNYAWGATDGGQSFKFICEIPRSETQRLLQENRDFTYGTNITDPSLAPRGPKFTMHPSNTVLTNRSHLPSIECNAIGNPQPSYSWHRTDVTGSVEEVISMSAFYTISNGKLTFNQINEKRDAGDYHCEASNIYGSIRSAPAKVTFGSIAQFPNVPQGVTRVALYQGTYLNCNPPTHKPAISYQWMKGRSFLIQSLNSYFFLSADGNLYFSEVQQNDEGDYHCIVTLKASPGDTLATSQPPTETSLSIRLDVLGDTAALYPPQIHDEFPAVFPKSPKLGQTITIECLAYGRIPLKYGWTKTGDVGIPSKAYVRNFGRVLVIPNVQFMDEGSYTCHVTGRTQVASKDFLLTIGAKPYFTNPLKDLIVDENSDVTWRCGGIASPRASYSWYKNSRLISTGTDGIEITSNVLRIRNLQKNVHEGMYSCEASNIYGTAMTSGQLKVLSLKPSFAKNPLRQSILAANNGNLTIPCIPEAAPVPTITWLKNGGQMSLPVTDGNQRGAQQLTNGFLKIVGVSFGDGGFYTCVATNKNGESKSTGSVSVVGGITIVTQLPNVILANRNDTVFIECQATYDATRIDLVFVWKFNGRVIDFSQDSMYEKSSRVGIRGLLIHFIDYHHSGVYECVAMSTITQSSISTKVNVQGPPGMPGNIYRIKGSETTRTVTIKWTVPPNHGSPIQEYNIEAQTMTNPNWRPIAMNLSDFDVLIPGNLDSDKRQYTVTGLIPFNSYHFRVYARNRFPQPGEYSKPSEYIQLKPDKPVTAVQNVGGGGGSVGVLMISWQLLSDEERCGPNVGYKIYWRKNGTTDRFQVKNLTETDYMFKKMVSGKSISYTVNLNDENLFYLPYEVKVGVFNLYGDGPNSTTTVVYSSEGIPLLRPTNVNGWEINATALWVTWDPMPNTREAIKGVIQGYEINVEDANNPNRKGVTAYHYGYMSGNNVIGLEPNTDYWVTVQVFNTAGESNPSEKQLLGTCLNPPLLYPEFVDILSDGPNSVYVKWRGVSTGLFEETLRGYKIRWWLLGENIKSANDTIVGKQTHGVVYGIAKGYVYALRVLGFSKGGDGKMSPTQYFTLGGRVHVDSRISDIKLAGTSLSPSLVILCFLCFVQFIL